MMTIRFKTDNAAFDGDATQECARIVQDVSVQLFQGYTSGVCHDINGNKVGTWSLT